MTANPLSIDSKAMLKEAAGLIEESQVDNLVVVEEGKPVGMLDVQDLVKLDLLK
jgi:signal-transduction protein with cAMP-binding, CBS, and nucleotidyltransferase domain